MGWTFEESGELGRLPRAAPSDKIQNSPSHAQTGLWVHSPEEPSIFPASRLLTIVTSTWKVFFSLPFLQKDALLTCWLSLVTWWEEAGTQEFCFGEFLLDPPPEDTCTVPVLRELTGTIKYGIWDSSLSRAREGH